MPQALLLAAGGRRARGTPIGSRPFDGPALNPPGYQGHAHFWQHVLSRRQLARSAAGGAALTATAGLWLPGLAAAASPVGAAPKPIPGGTDVAPLLGLPMPKIFHFFFPAFGQEISTITDFVGFVAAAEIQGKGTATNTLTHATSTLYYDADMRFMDGTYVGVDGHTRQGTFGFI